MAKLTNGMPRVTRSGVTIRVDDRLGGVLCYTPNPGVLYAVAGEDAPQVIKWLDLDVPNPPSEIYRHALGFGWSRTTGKLRLPVPQLLPQASAWPSVPNPEWPIVVNWLITGRCPLACRYCYAEDLMRNDSMEPANRDLSVIAEEILKLRPTLVVITGGDPLFSPNLRGAIESLAGRVGIVVDTSGLLLKEEHLDLFSRSKVSLRISIDSQIPAVHDSQRPISQRYPKLLSRGGTLAPAIDALCRAMDRGLGVTVQTVATKKSANNLVSLGDVLYRLGVKSWRIFKVAPSVSSMIGYRLLVGTHHDDGRPTKGKKKDGPYEHAFAEVLKARITAWQEQMAVQVTMNDVPNSVILVTPDGRFVTESNTGQGKIVLDARSPKSPSIRSVRSMVSMSGHSARYLNLTSPQFQTVPE